MQRWWRVPLTCVLLAAGLVVLPTAPVAALDVEVTQCENDDAFVQALNDVRNGAGGTITFDCGPDPVTITLDSQQDIPSTALGVVIDGGNMVTLSGGNTTRLFRVQEGAFLELRNITLIDGNGSGSGGAILNGGGVLNITNSTLRENSASATGGAIAILDGSWVEITGSTLSGNESGSANGGGAIYIQDSAILTITDSTLSGNSANGSGGAITNFRSPVFIASSTLNGNTASASGGAIQNFGAGSRLTVTNSTMTGNSASIWGGAIISQDGVVSLTSSTLVDNSASGAIGPGDAIYNSDISPSGVTRSVVTFHSSIVTGDTACSGQGTFNSEGHNLSNGNTCNLTADSDLPNTNPMLQALGDYGGPTQTRRPQPASQAVDAIPSDECAVFRDQRGVPRPQNTMCDIGAVELADGLIITGVTADPDTFDEPGSTTITVGAFVEPPQEGPAQSLEYAFDCDGNSEFEVPPQASNQTTCEYLDDGQVTVNVQVYADNETGTGSVEVTINNLRPEIGQIEPEIEGGEVVITVTASDPAGPADPLTYAFDCNYDGIYELDNDRDPVGRCPAAGLGSAQQIGVQVSDGDGGVVTMLVDATIAYELCIDRTTGEIHEASPDGCGQHAQPVSLPEDGPLTFCANRVTGELHLSTSGQCSRTQLTLVLPDDGPVTVCVHRVTGQMRLAGSSGCTRYEVAREVGPAGA